MNHSGGFTVFFKDFVTLGYDRDLGRLHCRGRRYCCDCEQLWIHLLFKFSEECIHVEMGLMWVKVFVFPVCVESFCEMDVVRDQSDFRREGPLVGLADLLDEE